MAGDEDLTVHDEPVTVTDPGTHTVEFRPVYQAGNVGAWRSVEFTIG